MQTNFSSLDLLKQVYRRNTTWKYILEFCVLGITLLFFIILSGPYLKQSQIQIQREGIDIEIVLDVSYSMIAEDILPSRIESAKDVIKKFLQELHSDRVWVVLFAGKPFHSVPLSYDYEFLRDFIDQISVESIDQNVPELQWTAIWDALILAWDALLKDTREKREKIIILMTDGEANRGIDPKIAIKDIASKGIKTYVIGIWKDEQTYIDVYTGPWFVRKVPVWWLDEPTLKNIADTSGGTYYRADDSESFEKILSEIGELEKTPLEETRVEYNKTVHVIPLGILWLLLAVFGYIISIKRIYVS